LYKHAQQNDGMKQQSDGKDKRSSSHASDPQAASLSSWSGDTAQLMQLQHMYGNRAVAQLMAARRHAASQVEVQQHAPVQRAASAPAEQTSADSATENKTGLPDSLKSGIENLSGLAMDDVKVHYNSPKPAQLQALAYAQGTDIHLGQGQEKHLPHEAWHVVQQKQGKVQPTIQAFGAPINDDPALESEATRMGAKAMRMGASGTTPTGTQEQAVQRKVVQRLPSQDYTGKADGIYWEKSQQSNHNGEAVPGRLLAVMKSPNDGGKPSVDPPGWDWLKKKFGRLKGKWVRFHIINAQLGGPGNHTMNLVPTRHTVNHNANWRSLEENAKVNANMNDEWTYVDVSITYDGSYPAGIPSVIDAEWGKMKPDGKWVLGNHVRLDQGNPDDGEGFDYKTASEMTKSFFRDLGLNKAQTDIFYGLINNTYSDQEDFDDAVETQEGTMAEELLNSKWYDTLNRLYVDEDDDLDGPFPVVVKVT